MVKLKKVCIEVMGVRSWLFNVTYLTYKKHGLIIDGVFSLNKIKYLGSMGTEFGSLFSHIF
jgi:hypothetical protein